MFNIQFTASYGDEKKTVTITKPMLDSNSYTINVDGWNKGEVYYRYNKWWLRPSTDHSDLTADDALILGKMIEHSPGWKKPAKQHYRFYNEKNETFKIFDLPDSAGDLDTRLRNQLFLYERDAGRKLFYEQIDNPEDFV